MTAPVVLHYEGRWVQREQGLYPRRHKTHHRICLGYGPPNLRLFPACPGTHRETSINSREVCRAAIFLGVLEAGKTPEPFPLSRPPFSPAFTPALPRCQQAPHPRAERNAWVSARPAVLREDSLGGSRARGRARGNRCCLSPGPGAADGKLRASRWARGLRRPRRAARRARLAGTRHRHLPPRPTRTDGARRRGRRRRRPRPGRAQECDRPRGRGGWFLR